MSKDLKTVNEVLGLVNEAFQHFQDSFLHELGEFKKTTYERFDNLEAHLNQHDQELRYIKENMATKRQLEKLTTVLLTNNVISPFEASEVRQQTSN